ncbi:VOC family protein [Flavisphingomonas formosensis]|uniref:VOC family protein n=1 Tax=Flavisphingomonas formosensis TaxID=861534 RepID=UPI0012FBECD7|nr:VOC family protein [Sphingomonas formosensis]
MATELNHIIIWCNDQPATAAFFAGVLGRPAPRTFAHFHVVDMDNGVSLDFMEKHGTVSPQHYAFLIDEEDFDTAFARISAAGLDYWADPACTRRGEINHNDGGRGLYFQDPNRHLLEIITRPYGAR